MVRVKIAPPHTQKVPYNKVPKCKKIKNKNTNKNK
jgi:hypothetical protein